MAASRLSTYFIEFTSPRGTKLFIASPIGLTTGDATQAYQFDTAADALVAFSMVLPQARSKLLPGCKVRSRARIMAWDVAGLELA